MIDNQCPVCACKTVSVLLEIEQVPVYCNVLWTDQESARRAPKGNIRLGFCHTCGHLFNLAFDPALMDYTQQYENSLHFSPRFQSYAQSLATRLVDRYDLRGKTIIEIGSGKGDFLRLICDIGHNRGVGFDPSYEPQPGDEDNPQVTFIQEYYSPAHYKADCICCRHVLEHVEFPHDFVSSVRQSIGDRETVVYFEVPNAAYTLRDLGIWDLIYEHYSYFSAPSLAKLFTQSGFEIQELAESFGGQYLGIEARAVSQPTVLDTDLSLLSAHVTAFASRYHEKVALWRQALAEIAANGHRAVIWGGGSKGVTFLNILNAADVIGYVVDINPRKQGKYVAGTGQQIVAPDFLKSYRPDLVIIMNPLYGDEIRQMMADLELSPELRVV